MSEHSRAPEPHEPNSARYWFRAKNHGWEWCRPVPWEGWLVGYLGPTAGGVRLYPPTKNMAAVWG